MKKFKSFVEDENLKDFEEDVLGEKAPNTADAILIRLISKQKV